MQLPLATPHLKGTGGQIGPDPEDFHVTEQPRYTPTGQGDHCFVRIRKRDLTSWEAARILAQAVGCRPADVGMAGIKDRHAVAEQWLSLPGVDPADLSGLDRVGLEVLETHRHGHKLRTGHLAGNRFVVRLVGVCPEAEARAAAVLEHLGAHGVYHYFGPQRFGAGGDNAQRGRALLAGGSRIRDRRERRLVVSAVQSELFNAYLARRAADGLDEPWPGELVQRTDSGGVFAAEDVAEVAGRLVRGEAVLTGPLFGPKMKRPEPGTRARELEERVLAEAGLSRADFEPWKRLAPGARRPLRLWPAEPGLRALPDGLEVRFALPPGGYATVVLREITKTGFAELRASGLAPAPEMP
jgi:tRNA pseudouridine13 synthase